MTDPARAELGAFLRARRAELTPTMVGLGDDGTPRRVPGLRRDEVARLATISVDYYTRLEQGRLQASATVLASLARALRLDHTQQTYLAELTGKAVATRRRPKTPRVRPAVRTLLDGLPHPAMLLGRFTDILAWNTGATAVYLDFAALPPAERNYTRLLFLGPRMRELYPDWEDAARLAAATLRMDTASHPHDPRLTELVGELSVRSPEFRDWWTDRLVSDTAHGTKRFHHPLVGDLALDCETWADPGDPDQRLMVLIAPPDSPSADALRILTSWQSSPA